MRVILACAAGAVAVTLAVPAAAQAQRPQIDTKKVDGTDGVYIFRNGNHQSMFIVTKAGVIATDPIGYGRPTGGADYVAEIRKVSDKSRTLSLGGTKLELTFVGLNHSDSTLVMRLPKEKILFVVDLVPVGTFP